MSRGWNKQFMWWLLQRCEVKWHWLYSFLPHTNCKKPTTWPRMFTKFNFKWKHLPHFQPCLTRNFKQPRKSSWAGTFVVFSGDGVPYCPADARASSKSQDSIVAGFLWSHQAAGGDEVLLLLGPMHFDTVHSYDIYIDRNKGPPGRN